MIRPASKWKGITEYHVNTFKTRIGYATIISELKKKGRKVYELFGANIGDWDHVNKAFTDIEIQAAKEEWGRHYESGTNLMEELKNSMAYFEKHFRNVECLPQDIIPIPGIAGGWKIIHDALLEPGSEVVCIAPAHYFWGPASYLHFYGAKAIASKCDEKNEWQPDLEDLRAKINKKTVAIVLDHPNNPTGAIYKEKALKGICEIAGEFDLPIISDEIYDLVLYDGERTKSMASIADDVPVITMYSTSKFFMKPGWRIGYMNFHDPEGKLAELRRVVDLLARTYGHVGRCIPTLIMAIGSKAFKGPFAESTEMMKKLEQRRNFSFKRLNEIEGVSCYKAKATLYLFPKVEAIGRTWKTDDDFITSLLKEEGILFVPGYFFGDLGVGHFRTLLLPPMDVLEEVYNRLERFLVRHLKSY
jgi:aspartate/methionine/tyrosine aminotransferase